MEKRIIVIDEFLLKNLEEIDNTLSACFSDEIKCDDSTNFSEHRLPGGIELYKKNQSIIYKAICEFNSFFNTDEVQIDKGPIYPKRVLEVEYDIRINELIQRTMKLQELFLDQLIRDYGKSI